jgi:molecular chaperone GrpE
VAISRTKRGGVVERDKDKTNIFSEFDSRGETKDASEARPEESKESDAPENCGTDAKSDELQALQDKHLRLAAEFENYKRLAQRDQREYSRFANEQLLKELLPVVDNLERAIQSAKVSRDNDTVIQGVQLTLKQFLETLGKFGVRQISSVGQPFDPSRHQAVTRIESKDVPENTVVEEYQKGYLLHERVLRPAMVAVATGGGGGHRSAGAPEDRNSAIDDGRSMGFKKPGASA